MIRSKTTLVIGPGAGLEIELPDKRELLTKMAGGFDFARLGSELQTRDMVLLARHFEKFARRISTTEDKLREAGQRIRTSARVGHSVDAVLEQHSDDNLAMAAGKLALIHYILQSEAASSKKIVFLGFDFDPQTVDFLFDYTYSHDPDVIAAVQGMNEPTMKAVLRLMRRRTGIEDEALVTLLDMRCFQFMRDYSLFLES
ncbi:MAG: hypothetical protein ABIT10_09620 [Alteraurantiacibacter sp.]